MARRPRRHAARRPNGVGAYHLFLSSALKKAMKGQKSPAARTAAFKKAQAEARAAKKKGFSAAMIAAAKSANVKAQAKKKTLRAKRAGKITVRTARKYAGGKVAYKKMTRAQRRELRAAGRRRKGMVSASRRAAAAAAKKVAPVRRRRVAAAKAASARRGAPKGGGKGVSLMKQAAAAYRAGKYKSMKEALKAMAGKKVVAAKPASKKPRRAKAPAAKPASAKAPRRAKKAAASKRGGKAKAPVTKAGKARRAMKRNPDFRGAFSGAKSFLGGLANLKLVGEAALAGVAHGFVAPKVHDLLEEYVPYSVDLPMVGRVSAASFSYTITGVAAGAALSAVGSAFSQPMLRDLGKVAAVSGLVMDVVGLVQKASGSSFGAIYDQGVTYGAISADGMTYGEIYNDGQTYGGVVADGMVEYGDVVIGEYGDAMPADAEDSGADFSVAEGEAMIAGPASWFQRFGRAPKRVMGIRSAKSRHAGREGHRWGWLIKLVGPEKAAQIAALPPEKRLRVIADLRRQAVSSLANAMAEQAAGTTGANLLPAPQDMGLDLTGAPAGVGGAVSYGAVYAGNGF